MKEERSHINNLLTCFFSGNSNSSEKDEILSWMQQSRENEDYCVQYYKRWAKDKVKGNHFNTDEGWKSFIGILKLKDKQHRLVIRRRWYYGVAAGITVIFCAFYFLKMGVGKVDIVKFAQNTSSYINMESSDVKLVLSEDSALTLGSNSPKIQYGTNKITVDDKTISNNASAPYNQLVVPWGRRSTLLLSDGTKIWLNAGTRLVYPESFTGDTREIYVEGEIYLEVAHNANRPFIVKTQDMDIRVLGTTFAITAYRNEPLNRVVLVNGSVRVTQHDQFAILHPNYMYESVKGKSVVQAVDVDKYISWVNGLYIFDSDRLENILDNLKKYYGINIIYDRAVAILKCSGKLDLNNNPSLVLKSISETAPIIVRYKGGRYYINLK